MKISDFRGSIQHLERIFHTDRHACVGAKEKAYWSTIAYRFLDEAIALTCARAKPEDLQRQAEIIEKVFTCLAENFPVTK